MGEGFFCYLHAGLVGGDVQGVGAGQGKDLQGFEGFLLGGFYELDLAGISCEDVGLGLLL